MREARSPRLAVLIDADNVSAKIVDRLFEEIASFGEASVRRIYGDFSSERSKCWSGALARHAITPQQQFAYTTGKNASDIALVIDAMDLLHSGRFDGFCLVSSDSDFTRLATRIREQGLDVFGFGERKTPESFQRACRRFVFAETLLPQKMQQHGEPALAASVPQMHDVVTALLRQALAQLKSDDGWVPLSAVGSEISKLVPNFSVKAYGCGRLSDLVLSSRAFELKRFEGNAFRVRPINPQSA
jgi:hypothetical protein